MRGHREWRTTVHTKRYTYLLGTLLAFVVVYAILGELRVESGRALNLAFLGVLVAALFAAGEGRIGARRITVLAVLLVLLQSGLVATDRPVTRVFAAVLLIAFFWGVTGVLLTDVLKTRRLAIGERIRGAICVYFLMGLAWAVSYGPIVDANPLAFAGLTGETGHVTSELVYFSFITQATVGYGDVTPVSQLARTLAWLQAFAGQMYVAITIARLVSSKDDTP